jgi:hypothetical protein
VAPEDVYLFGMFISTYIIIKSHRREMLEECALASAGDRDNARASWTSMQDPKLPQKEWKSEQQNADTLTRQMLVGEPCPYVSLHLHT